MAPSETATTTAVSLVRQLATIKRLQDAARRELAAITEELHNVRDENEELCVSLYAPRKAFQVYCLSLVELVSKSNSVFS